MWKNFSVEKKCIICIFPLLLVIIGSYAYFNKTLASLQNTITLLEKYDDIRPSFKQREIEHMQWVQQLILFVSLQQNRELFLEIQPTRCELGKWLSSSERDQVEEMIPSLAEILERIHEPHRRLHQSAVTIRSLAGDHNWDEARRTVHSETLPALEEIRSLLGMGTAEIGKAVAEMRVRADSDREHSVLITRLAMALGGSIGVLCFMAFLFSLLHPARKP
ncbi:MAG: CZB domain-containing protein [Desulfovibrionaceae bacterium]|nr:CZB domain-containing protein [Desulfovibrionaceae bacterium]